MPSNPATTIYCGNLDDRVTERVLYDIMVEAGRVSDVYIPKDKETKKSKGYGFAEFETEEGAQYALKLFSGLVVLFNRSVRLAMSSSGAPAESLNNNGFGISVNGVDNTISRERDLPNLTRLPQMSFYGVPPLARLPQFPSSSSMGNFSPTGNFSAAGFFSSTGNFSSTGIFSAPGNLGFSLQNSSLAQAGSLPLPHQRTPSSFDAYNLDPKYQPQFRNVPYIQSPRWSESGLLPNSHSYRQNR